MSREKEVIEDIEGLKKDINKAYNVLGEQGQTIIQSSTIVALLTQISVTLAIISDTLAKKEVGNE